MGKNSLNNFICHLSWLKKLCPCSYTSPSIVETLWVIIFWVWVLTHPTPPLHDPHHPHPTPIWHTPPYPTPSWPILPHPYMTHPFMTHATPTPSWPTHPTPPLHDPPHPTPPHPFMNHPPHPTPPHPTPPLVHFWAQRSLFSWAASLCLPLGRQ